MFEPLSLFQTFLLAFSKNYVNPKPFNQNAKKHLTTLNDFKKKAEFKKLGSLVIFHEVFF